MTWPPFPPPPLVGCLVRIELAYQMPCRSVLEPPWRYSFRSRQRHSAPFAKVLGYCVWNLVRVEIACGGSSGSRGGVLRGRGDKGVVFGAVWLQHCHPPRGAVVSDKVRRRGGACAVMSNYFIIAMMTGGAYLPQTLYPGALIICVIAD